MMMKELKLKKLSSLFIALVLPVQAAWALIPEPDNLVYGTVTLDGYPLTAANRDVSLVVKYAGREVSSYTMGDNPSMLNKYLLEIPVDSILQRNTNALRTGDKLEIYYQVGTSSSKAAELVVDERGTTKEINLQLTSEHIIVGADPSAIDSDGDGISDVYEVANGMNPLNASDAALDNDGDGLSNLQEYMNGTDINVDDNPPHLIPPLDRTVPATGLFTAVNLGVATAFDYKDGTLSATHDGNGVYAPGEHIVNWSVSDAAGNVVTATQLIKVIPLVNFHQDQLVAEGNTVTITAELNGLALQYPVTIPYTVSGTATAAAGDHNLANGEIIISGGLTGSASFQILDDAVAGEGTESVVVTMGVPSNAVAGYQNVYVAHILEGNIAPTVRLVSSQDGSQSNLIVIAGSFVTVSANVQDNNPGDTQTYDWSLTDSALIDTDGDVTDSGFVFDASALLAGSYRVSVTVTDSLFATANTDLILQVVDTLPVLSSLDTDGDGLYDDQEGFGDTDGDGIADYLDVISQTNMLQINAQVSDHYLLETEFGLSLSLGYGALNSANITAVVSTDEVNTAYNVTLNAANYPGGLFDFRINNLSAQGDSARIVLPLTSAIPEGASFYQMSLASGSAQWSGFVEDNNNAVYSAEGVEGYCPSPGDVIYTPGLTAGNWCVMLLIEDGGQNDADGMANQRIDSLGGIYVSTAGSGGGTSGYSLLVMLLIFLLAGYFNRRKKASIFCRGLLR